MKNFGFLFGLFGVIVLKCFTNAQISCFNGQRLMQFGVIISDTVNTTNCAIEEVCHLYNITANTQGLQGKWQ